MTEPTSLTDWGAVEETPPPLVKRKRIVQSPHTGKIAGFVGREQRRGLRAYTALRYREHLYYSDNAYALSDTIIDTLESVGVTHVFIHRGTEESEADVYEFRLRQWRESGRAVPRRNLVDEADTQTYVRVEDRVHLWAGHAGDLFVRSFEQACDAIGWRGYDPDLKRERQEGRR